MFYEGGERIESIKAYLLGIFCASIFCAIITKLVGNKGTMGVVVKLIAGIFLAVTVIRPLAAIDFSGALDWTLDYSRLGAEAAAEGESQMRNALSEGIKTRTEAYILNKAKSLNVDVRVEVTLSEDKIPVPYEVRLTGKVSPYAKSRLQAIIAQDLGIDKERQIWT